MSAPLFPLGQIVATPGALDASRDPGQFLKLLARHVRGDWGCVDPDDSAANDEARRCLGARQGDAGKQPLIGRAAARTARP